MAAPVSQPLAPLPCPHEERKSNSPPFESGQSCDLLVTNKRQKMWHYELLRAHELLPRSLEHLRLEFCKKPDHLGWAMLGGSQDTWKGHVWAALIFKSQTRCRHTHEQSSRWLCAPDIKTHFESAFESSQLQPQHHGADKTAMLCLFQISDL